MTTVTDPTAQAIDRATDKTKIFALRQELQAVLDTVCCIPQPYRASIAAIIAANSVKT